MSKHIFQEKKSKEILKFCLLKKKGNTCTAFSALSLPNTEQNIKTRAALVLKQTTTKQYCKT